MACSMLKCTSTFWVYLRTQASAGNPDTPPANAIEHAELACASKMALLYVPKLALIKLKTSLTLPGCPHRSCRSSISPMISNCLNVGSTPKSGDVGVLSAIADFSVSNQPKRNVQRPVYHSPVAPQPYPQASPPQSNGRA